MNNSSITRRAITDGVSDAGSAALLRDLCRELVDRMSPTESFAIRVDDGDGNGAMRPKLLIQGGGVRLVGPNAPVDREVRLRVSELERLGRGSLHGLRVLASRTIRQDAQERRHALLLLRLLFRLRRSSAKSDPLALVRGVIPTTFLSLTPDVRVAEALMYDSVASAFPFEGLIVDAVVSIDRDRTALAFALLGARIGTENGGRWSQEARELAGVLELYRLGVHYHHLVRGDVASNGIAGEPEALWIMLGDYLFSCASCLAASFPASIRREIGQSWATWCEGLTAEEGIRFEGDRDLGLPSRSISSAYVVDVLKRSNAWLLASTAYLGCLVSGADADVALRLRNGVLSAALGERLLDEAVFSERVTKSLTKGPSGKRLIELPKLLASSGEIPFDVPERTAMSLEEAVLWIRRLASESLTQARHTIALIQPTESRVYLERYVAAQENRVRRIG
jgi:hypothetical protein